MANYKNKETGEVAELIKDDTTKVLKLQSTGKEVIASKFQFKNEWEPIDEPQVTTKEEPVKESEPVFGSKENDEKAMNAINAMTNKLMKDVKKSTSKKATTNKEEVKPDKPEELPNNVAPKDLKEIAKDISKKGVKGVPENLKKVKKVTKKEQNAIKKTENLEGRVKLIEAFKKFVNVDGWMLKELVPNVRYHVKISGKMRLSIYACKGYYTIYTSESIVTAAKVAYSKVDDTLLGSKVAKVDFADTKALSSIVAALKQTKFEDSEKLSVKKIKPKKEGKVDAVK